MNLFTPSNYAALSEDAKFGLWLEEWNHTLDQTPQAEEPDCGEDGTGPAADLTGILRPFDSGTPVAGEIRLLSSRVIPGDRPAWVAVLETGSRGILVAPLSPFSVPATRNELLTPEGVINIGLAVWIAATGLQKSWIGREKHLDPEQLQNAIRFLESHRSCLSCPDDLLKLTGPRLSRHASDPRHAYLDQEKQLFSPLHGSSVQRTPDLAILNPLPKEDPGLRLAADDQTPAAPAAEFELPGTGLQISFLLDLPEKNLRWTVFDSNGNPSTALSGFRLMFPGSNLPDCVLQGSHGSVEASGLNFVLTNPDGTVLRLDPVGPSKSGR